jgi:Protein of unknown function (DUF3618)
MQREPAEIEREIELTRTYLADTVDAIAHKVSPKEVAGRTLATVKAKVEGIKTGSVETFTSREGEFEVKRKLRVDRVGMAAGGVAGLIGLVVAIRKFRRR